MPEFRNKLKPNPFLGITERITRLSDLHHIQRLSPVLRFQDAPSRFHNDDGPPDFRGYLPHCEQKSELCPYSGMRCN